MNNENLDFELLRCQVSKNNGTLLENLSREDLLISGVEKSIQEITDHLLLQAPENESFSRKIEALKEVIRIFIDILEKRVTINTSLSKKGLIDTLKMIKVLEYNSVDAEILAKLTKVLMNIVLSRENVINWEKRSEELLVELYGIFRFDAFLNIFERGKKNLGVSIYYLKRFNERQKNYLKGMLKKSILEHFQIVDIVKNIPMEFTEKALLQEEDACDSDRVELKQHEFMSETPGIGGILGIAVFITNEISQKEEDILNSLLSIMTLIIGSSRGLSRAIRELEFYAGHDPLTGLYNRRMFEHFLQYEISRVKRKKYKFSMLMMDLDDFKYINDSYGHPFGDLFLKEVAGVLQGVLRDGDVVARLGGDEFSVILSETDIESGRVVAEKIKKSFHLRKIETPDKKSVPVKASIGLVEYPTHGTTNEELMIVVDAALYKAKELGKNNIFIPTPEEIKDSVKEQNKKFQFIQDGLEEGGFVPFFQPIFDIRKKEIVGYEALVRLVKDNKVVSAMHFIDMAERTGKIFDIDKITIQKAFQKKKKEKNDKLLFINLSGKEVSDKGFIDFLIHAAQVTGIAPSEVVFEITEREAVGDIANVMEFINRVMSRGFKLAIDDFGSGYSSFYYIKYLPVNFVKIDGEFVKELASQDYRDVAFVESIQTLCTKLGTKTVAEFIESENILKILGDIGIDFGQGFYLGPPEAEFIREEKSLL